ncbi:cob(I)yrinic acid a,c-diamide adenosyltransferase [Proteus faecis]|uniref:Corrinoid adenosyltransferase n=1 Tax=Proteus faecis TaxID=2050967 RepID=A0AAW7CSZ4_9GAMM|nr:cob(I)yrinic acid a,c-diamide adenosyltransferase [Proteus faecis]MBG3013631.1 cob(I)yrinic acid a,c-diamide adenosyltransferase [Proteus mirabilis]MDL5166158.1 cob(I)yrinic acid a,c-diamide adenosyltransferase [Proteus faecis]MDL5273578.1 cob(I)yrinic acid a,c-diamide adenosyltransferase [Proteus faecis]MDL5277148.1 cob(I)yrinic acid a,c-diamide adenosyltransferase [Proteus faecis]MDL5306138.1 cob(I)yrinic acid a,c-diamide adenosyltransferase [Proteus faecis]
MNNAQHQKRQQRLKEKVDTRIEQAQREQGIVIIFTGNGKGKTTAAMGTATRAVGHQKKVGVVQFIKGTWENGERNLLEQFGVPFYVMETGFTWETQDKSTDTVACLNTWQYALKLLNDPEYDLVILDEITYMITFNYLPLDEVISALSSRPAHQNVIITGRGCHRKLIELADTVTEMRPIKHAFDSGIKAQKGIDW